MKDEKKAEVKVESKDSDVIASISRRLSKVVKFLEEIHGADIDGDGRKGFSVTKLLVCVASCCVVLGVAFAEDIANWSSASGLTGSAVISHDGTDYTLTIDKISAEVVTTSGQSVSTAGTASPTNAAVITPASDVLIVTPIGQANDFTNTCTIANAVAGQYLQIIVSGTATNLLGLADSGNLKLSAAAVLDNNDSITFRGVGTDWVETSRSNN